MSSLQTSMMRAKGSRPDDWLKAQAQVAQAMLPDAEQPERMPLPLLPLAQLTMLQSALARETAGHASRTVQAAAALPALAEDPNTAQEALALVGATWQRWWSVQAQSLKEWTALAREMGHIRQAHSVTNYVAMEMNYALQAQAIVSNHSLAMTEWLDTVYVDTGWWLARKAPGLNRDASAQA
jgi:hypothetical protein